jgi:hypothetical protein
MRKDASYLKAFELWYSTKQTTVIVGCLRTDECSEGVVLAARMLRDLTLLYRI